MVLNHSRTLQLAIIIHRKRHESLNFISNDGLTQLSPLLSAIFNRHQSLMFIQLSSTTPHCYGQQPWQIIVMQAWLTIAASRRSSPPLCKQASPFHSSYSLLTSIYQWTITNQHFVATCGHYQPSHSIIINQPPWTISTIPNRYPVSTIVNHTNHHSPFLNHYEPLFNLYNQYCSCWENRNHYRQS